MITFWYLRQSRCAKFANFTPTVYSIFVKCELLHYLKFKNIIKYNVKINISVEIKVIQKILNVKNKISYRTNFLFTK